MRISTKYQIVRFARSTIPHRLYCNNTPFVKFASLLQLLIFLTTRHNSYLLDYIMCKCAYFSTICRHLQLQPHPHSSFSCFFSTSVPLHYFYFLLLHSIFLVFFSPTTFLIFAFLFSPSLISFPLSPSFSPSVFFSLFYFQLIHLPYFFFSFLISSSSLSSCSTYTPRMAEGWMSAALSCTV